MQYTTIGRIVGWILGISLIGLKIVAILMGYYTSLILLFAALLLVLPPLYDVVKDGGDTDIGWQMRTVLVGTLLLGAQMMM